MTQKNQIKKFFEIHPKGYFHYEKDILPYCQKTFGVWKGKTPPNTVAAILSKIKDEEGIVSMGGGIWSKNSSITIKQHKFEITYSNGELSIKKGRVTTITHLTPIENEKIEEFFDSFITE
jgi:hypothetical protein